MIYLDLFLISPMPVFKARSSRGLGWEERGVKAGERERHAEEKGGKGGGGGV